MSEAIAFDTHGFVKNPTQNGFTTEKAVALIQRDIADSGTSPRSKRLSSSG